MSNLTGTSQVFEGNTDAVHTSQLEVLGKRAWSGSGNEYIYLQGVGSTVAGDWVVYDESYATTRLVANEVGPVAIAMAAVNATTSYGWYQIYGVNTVARTDTVVADSSLYIDGTAGRADDLGVAGDLILGAYSMTADTSNVATVHLNYPSVSNDIGGSAGTTTLETPTGTVNDTNVDFVFTEQPLLVCVNGACYRVNNGWTWAAGTLTATLTAGAAGTGGDVFGLMT